MALSLTIGPNDLKDVARVAISAVNEFLRQYRYSTGAYWAQPIGAEDVIEFLIWRLYDGERATGPSVHASPAGGPLIGSGSESIVTPERDRAIRIALASEQESPFAFEVLLTAQEHLHRNRYRSAAIDAETAFEVMIAEFLRFHLAEIGRSDEEIESVFRDERGGYVSARILAKDVLRSELGIDFAGTAEFRDWEANVLDLRNEVVHGTAQPTPNAIRASIRDVDRARAKLRDLLSNR